MLGLEIPDFESISKSFQYALPILIFLARLKKPSLQQLLISTPNPCGNIHLHIHRPVWRWKDVGRKRRKNRFPNANLLERESIKSG
jgi:hypothetical protein